MTTRTIIKPGPGKIAILPVPASEEHPVPGSNLKLYLVGATHNEGLIGRVTAVCGRYVSDAGAEFEPNYDVGDLVIIGKFTGTRLTIGRETYTILHESDVLASIESEDDVET